MQSSLLRGTLILLLFATFKPAVAYVGAATLVSGLYALAFTWYYKCKFLPGLRVRARYFRWEKMRDLLGAGIWNTVNYLSTVLSTGFHLLLASIFLGGTPMGLLALAMTVPAMVSQLAVNLATAFLPSLAFAYSRHDLNEMKRQVRVALTVTGILAAVPLAVLMVFGKSFFGLWVPGVGAEDLSVMATFAAAGIALSCLTQPLQNIFVTTNSQRTHALASLMVGLLNVLIAITLLASLKPNVFAILITALVSTSVRVVFVTLPMAGRQVGESITAFVPDLARGVGYIIVGIVLGAFVREIYTPISWLGLGAVASLVGGVSAAVNLAIFSPATAREVILRNAGRFLRSRR